MTRPPLIRTDMANLPPSALALYLPPGVTLMASLCQVLPVTSVPLSLARATAALAMSVRYAPAEGAFLITLNCFAIRAVVTYAVGFMTPIPSGAGQMSALISFICHVWWPLPSVGPFCRTMLTQSPEWSRQYAQPMSDAATKRFATSTCFGSLRYEA